MKPFCEVQARNLTSGVIKTEVGARGYVLVREVVPREEITRVLGAVTPLRPAARWLLPGHAPLERVADVKAACGDPDPGFKQTYQQVFNLAAFHALPHPPELQRVMRITAGNRP